MHQFKCFCIRDNNLDLSLNSCHIISPIDIRSAHIIFHIAIYHTVRSAVVVAKVDICNVWKCGNMDFFIIIINLILLDGLYLEWKNVFVHFF